MSLVFSVSRFFLFQSLGKAAEQKGKNDAGVASRAAQKCAGSHFADLRDGNVIAELGEFQNTVSGGHGHIRTGVTVRNGEDVQRVHLFFLVSQIVGAGNECIPELSASHQKYQLPPDDEIGKMLFV